MSPSPKWMEHPGQHGAENGKQSKKHEQRIAKKLGGKRMPGSGNKKWSNQSRRISTYQGNGSGFNPKTATRKREHAHEDTDCGDIVADGFVYEHKFTRASSMSIKKDWLQKVGEGARRKQRNPGLIITFQNEDGTPGEEWVAIPIHVHQGLIKK